MGAILGSSPAAPSFCNVPSAYIQGISGFGTAATLGNGNLRVSPWYFSQTWILAGLGAEFTVAGDVPSLFAVALFGDSGQGYPGALLNAPGSISTGTGNAGTVATGGTPGVYMVTPATATAYPAGLYWIGGVVQGVTVTQPTMRTGYPTPTFPIGSSAVPPPSTTLAGYIQGSVTGTLPATFVGIGTAGGSGTIPRMIVQI